MEASILTTKINPVPRLNITMLPFLTITHTSMINRCMEMALHGTQTLLSLKASPKMEILSGMLPKIE
jgi:hypothetical protein